MRSCFFFLLVAVVVSACAGGDPKGPTSVYLTIQNGASLAAPDELRVTATGEGGVVFSDERLPMSGALQPQRGAVLGTVTLYVGNQVSNLQVEVSGYLNQIPVSRGTATVRIVADRQVSARVVLQEIVDGGQVDDGGDNGDDAGDGGIDGPGPEGPDVGVDGPADATSPDVPAGDVGAGDGGAPDVGRDVAPDLSPDVVVDASVDALVDAPVDAPGDVVGDVIPDAGQESPPAPGILAHYKFDETGGTVAVDSSGNGHNGTLMGGATLGPGLIGNDVSLNGMTGSYIALPAGMLDSVRDVTIATWVRVRAARAWQRLFDFGIDANRSMYLVPQDTSVLRFAITTGGLQAEQRVFGTSAVPVATWQHVAVVLGPVGGTLYVNGAAVATNAALALRPANLLPRNLWLGRSQNAMSPYFDGELDDFRIYARALSATEITALFIER